ncbi:hypothetical protein ACW5R3_04410 [Bizionia sp. KMM 8389]
MMKHLLILCLCLFSFTSSVNAQGNMQTEKPTDSMVFFNYNIKKIPNSSPEINFLNYLTTKGRIKGFHQEKILDKPDNLVCELLDKDLNVIETLYIKNPLNNVIEYVNDDGNLEKKQIILEHTDFSFRMPYSEVIKYSRIRIITNSKITNYIITKL